MYLDKKLAHNPDERLYQPTKTVHTNVEIQAVEIAGSWQSMKHTCALWCDSQLICQDC